MAGPLNKPEETGLSYPRCVSLLVLLSALNLPGSALAALSLRLELANDVILSSDNQFTNGTSLIISSDDARVLENTRGTPAFGKSILSWSIPDKSGLTYRESWVVGQNMQTPAEIGNRELITNDVPYVGILAWGNSFYGFDDEHFLGAQWLVGWVGEEALAEQAQQGVHGVLGGDDAAGWDNQLDSEPILNVFFSAKHRLYRHRWFDVAVAGDVALGNFFTFLQPGLEFRFGNRPAGFHFVPDPIGRGMDYDATGPISGASGLYGSVTFRSTHFGWALPREGNLLVDNEWTDSNSVRVERTVGQTIIGLHWVGQNFGANLSLWLSTDTVDNANLPLSEDSRNSFGSFMAEYRF